MREPGNIEYKDLKNGNMQCNLTLKKILTGISKKKPVINLEFNLEKVNLNRSHSITVMPVGNFG